MDRATHRIDDAGEFAQQAIARRLDQTAAILRKTGDDQVGLKRFHPPEGALLVDTHQPAIARDIRREHGR